MSPYGIEGKVVLVTGASLGIGRATAKTFAREGARVALVARNAARLEELSSQIGGSARPFPFDLTKVDAIPGLVRDIKSKMGPVDVLINNAAFAVVGLVEDCPIEQYRRNFELNFYAPIAMIQAVLPEMKAGRSGQIINVSSGVGKRALPGVSAYSATKFALNGLTESLRLEVREFGIDVIAIFPGRVESSFHDRMEHYGRLKRKLPPIKARRPEAISEMILAASRERARERTVWGPGLVGAHLNYWAPWLVDWILMKKFPV